MFFLRDHSVRVRRIEDYCPLTTLARMVPKLQIGDVFLVSNGALNWIRPIVLYQKQFREFSPASKKFTHAGIYVGNETVVHSTPDIEMDKLFAGGVAGVHLNEFFGDGVTFAVLRFPDLTIEHHQALHDAVRSHIDKPYDYMSILRCLGFKTSLRRRSPRDGAKDLKLARALICTDFIFAVYDEIFQHKNPFNQPNGYSTPVRLPCEFYANPKFVDVDLGPEPAATS